MNISMYISKNKGEEMHQLGVWCMLWTV
jgi:hypothetical protein